MKALFAIGTSLSLAVLMTACGSASSAGGGGGAAAPAKKVVTINTYNGSINSQSISIDSVSYLSQVKITVDGATDSDIIVGLLDAPTQLSLISATTSNSTSMSYGLSASSLNSGTYAMTVVVRDRAVCQAKEQDTSICQSPSGITQIINDYDTTQYLTLTVGQSLGTTGTSTDTSISGSGLDTSTDTGTGGGLFKNFCTNGSSNAIKSWFCSLTGN